MTECYECARLAELVAENSQIRAKVDEIAELREDVAERDDVIAVLKAESAKLEVERDQWREAAGNAHAMWEKADNERNELQAKVDELTAEINAIELGQCSTCKFAGIHDGKRWPGREFKGRMYCVAWSDGYMAEWTKPDGFCHMWKPKEGDE